MAWLQMYTRSAALKMPVGFHALLPPHWDTDKGGPYPALYLLHGKRDDASSWLRNSMLEFHLRGRPLAVIMPNGYNGFWADAKTGQNYLAYVTEELPALCEGWFPLSPRREDRFVAGFSMGGFGALQAALNHPGRFAKAGAISPVVDLSHYYEGGKNSKLTVDLPWIFGTLEEYRRGRPLPGKRRRSFSSPAANRTASTKGRSGWPAASWNWASLPGSSPPTAYTTGPTRTRPSRRFWTGWSGRRRNHGIRANSPAFRYSGDE